MSFEVIEDIYPDEDAQDPTGSIDNEYHPFSHGDDLWEFADKTFGAACAAKAIETVARYEVFWQGPGFQRPWLGISMSTHHGQQPFVCGEADGAEPIEMHSIKDCHYWDDDEIWWDEDENGPLYVWGFWSPSTTETDLIRTARRHALAGDQAAAKAVLVAVAESELEPLRQWARGDTWQYTLELVDDEGEVVEESGVGGFFGEDHAEDGIEDQKRYWRGKYQTDDF